MTFPVCLAELSSAEVSVGRATRLIRETLQARPRSGEYVYQALSAWCWRALGERRVDEELRLWFDLMEKTAALLEAQRQRPAALKITALSDLVYASVQFSERNAVDAMLRRPNVQAVLEALFGRASMSKHDLMRRTGLKQANLSRIAADMMAARLLDREAAGREAYFFLTPGGKQAALGLAARRRSRPAAIRTAPRQKKPETRPAPPRLRISMDDVRCARAAGTRLLGGDLRPKDSFTGVIVRPEETDVLFHLPSPLRPLPEGPPVEIGGFSYRRKPPPDRSASRETRLDLPPSPPAPFSAGRSRLSPPVPNYVAEQTHEVEFA